MSDRILNYAIILACGSGNRFGGELPKQFAKIYNKTILEYTLEVFNSSKYIDRIIVVTHPDYKTYTSELLKNYNKVYKIIEGGNTRKQSSYNALLAINDIEANVLIHDGVRPFVTEKIIADSIKALENHKAVTTAITSTDTIIETENGFIKHIPKRQNLRRVQTPQGFKYSLIKQAHELAKDNDDFTDDCGLIVNYDLEKVYVVEGDINNIKITYPQDINIAKEIIDNNRG